MRDGVDVLVVGAGSAGSTAAIAAARAGASTLLVDRFGFLGGTSTAVLDTFYAFYTPGAAPQKIVSGIPDEVVARLTERGMAFERPNTYGAGTGVTYDPESLKRVWDELVDEAGARTLLHAFVFGVEIDEGRIVGVDVATKSGVRQVRPRVSSTAPAMLTSAPSRARPSRGQATTCRASQQSSGWRMSMSPAPSRCRRTSCGR